MTPSYVTTILNGYQALGSGASSEVLAMFDQHSAGGAEWMIVGEHGRHSRRAGRPPVGELFPNVPGDWELTRAEAARYETRGDKVIVSGHVHCRPSRTWEMMTLPFSHVWTLVDGRPERVISYPGGAELRRVEALAEAA